METEDSEAASAAHYPAFSRQVIVGAFPFSTPFLRSRPSDTTSPSKGANIADFTGFPAETVAFLRGIQANNSKEWFDAHRRDYEDHWLESARAFVTAAGVALEDVAPAVCAEPRVNGSIFRINRDIRFSKDKRPYKDYLDFWFWEGERKTAASGFYLRITPTALGIGAGAHSFDKDRLAAFRSAVVDPKSGRALASAVTAVEAAGWPVKGERYRQLPRGFEASTELEERLLLYASLWTGEEEPHPKSLHSRRLIPYAIRRWAQSLPLHRWLVDTLG